MLKITCIWGAYGALRQRNLVHSFRDVPGSITGVVRNYFHGLAMGYFRAAEVEVRNCGYTFLDDVADPFNKKFLDTSKLPFTAVDRLPTKSKHEFFKTVNQTLDENDALGQSDTILWRAILNHAVQDADQQDRVQGKARI